MSEILTIADIVALSTIVEVAQRTAKVRWLIDTGDVAEGTARSIGDQSGMFLRENEDIRDAYLRITSVSGFEHFMPVRDVMRLVKRNEFAAE